MKRGVLLLGLLLWTSSAWGAVAFQAACEGNSLTGLSATLQFPCTVSAGSDLVLIVGISAGCNTACPNDAATLTFDGTPMTPVSVVAESSLKTWIFRLISPPVTTANLVFTPSNSQRMAGGGVVLTGVDQSTPLGTPGTNVCASATTCTAAVTVPADGLGVGTGGKADTDVPLVTVTPTERWNDCSTSGTTTANRCSAGATTASPGSQNFTFTSANPENITVIAVPVNATAAPAAPRLSPVFLLLRR